MSKSFRLCKYCLKCNHTANKKYLLKRHLNLTRGVVVQSTGHKLFTGSSHSTEKIPYTGSNQINYFKLHQNPYKFEVRHFFLLIWIVLICNICVVAPNTPLVHLSTLAECRTRFIHLRYQPFDLATGHHQKEFFSPLYPAF